jgi:hypothetical protein
MLHKLWVFILCNMLQPLKEWLDIKNAYVYTKRFCENVWKCTCVLKHEECACVSGG